tara:strand:+ start:2503 stop:2748 length:246 start_codon:yes stop_codon:yes gene_type:complete
MIHFTIRLDNVPAMKLTDLEVVLEDAASGYLDVTSSVNLDIGYACIDIEARVNDYGNAWGLIAEMIDLASIGVYVKSVELD